MKNYWTQSKKNIFVAAHRGCSTKYPENTMPAFKAALDAGVDQIEFDLHVTLDNEIVIMHDSDVSRTTNGKGKLSEMTLAQIKELDAGSYKGEEFVGTRVPTFIEFMDLVKDHPTLTLDVEIKEYPQSASEDDPAYLFCDRVLKILDDYGYTDRVVINSFSNPLNEYIYKKYGKKYRQHVYYPLPVMVGPRTINPYEYAYCACMFADFYSKYDTALKMAYDKMAEIGPQPWAGAFVKNADHVDAVIERGAMLITCNDPVEILRILREKGYHS